MFLRLYYQIAVLFTVICVKGIQGISRCFNTLFSTLSAIFTVELSSNSIDQIVFTVTMNLVDENYIFTSMVRCLSHHFTVSITDTKSCWVYIDDMCVSVRNYTSFHGLLHNHCNGRFFAIYEKSSISNNLVSNLVGCQTRCQKSNDLLTGTLPIGIPSFDNWNSDTLTKSSAIVFYAICFSVLESCAYWTADTLDAIVEIWKCFL